MKYKNIKLKIDVEYGNYEYHYLDSADWTENGIEIETDYLTNTIKAKLPEAGTILLEYREIPREGLAASNFKLWISNSLIVHFNEKSCFLKFENFIGGDWAGYVQFINTLESNEELRAELDLISTFLGGDIVPHVENTNEWRGITYRTPKDHLDLRLDDVPHVKLFNIEREKRMLADCTPLMSERNIAGRYKI